MFHYTRDFDAFDLRLRLPAVVSKLHKLVNRNGGVTYIHCTAGLGRAPAVAVGSHSLVLFCFPIHPTVFYSPFVSVELCSTRFTLFLYVAVIHIE
jgi:hypothetical protein